MSNYGTTSESSKLIGGHEQSSGHDGDGSVLALKESFYVLFGIQLGFLLILSYHGHIGTMSEELQDGVGNLNLSNFTSLYNMFLGVQVMMFCGFGYLMTFLKRYGLGALGFTMIITCICLQWGVIAEASWTMYSEGDWGLIEVHLPALINGSFAAAALLISFGAVIGKISPLQLVVFSLIEVVVYTFNKVVLLQNLIGLADDGGTIIIHMFGAYFGLSIAYQLGKPEHSVPESESSNVSDIFSLIGTIFLWIYWPSFVAGPLVADAATQQRAVVNTVLALSASTLVAFAFSVFFSSSSKFRPVDIQNATLAGGVSIGCVASLSLSGGDAILIGILAGGISTLGFNRIQATLDGLGLHDSCGVNNLHGMPSILGALFSAAFAYHKGPLGHDAPNVYWAADPSLQGSRQLQGILCTLVVAIVGGTVTGKILSILRPKHATNFADSEWWEIAENPYPTDLLNSIARR